MGLRDDARQHWKELTAERPNDGELGVWAKR